MWKREQEENFNVSIVTVKVHTPDNKQISLQLFNKLLVAKKNGCPKTISCRELQQSNYLKQTSVTSFN